MSDDIAISLKNVSKVFKRYHHPSDRLKEIFLPGKIKSKEFWALDNINLEIPKGETVGIIGCNGSGKSTLLQIIAGTLQPTSGEVQVSGRVSALLELGSGFNPEFTGRQNVFFNGQILGLNQEEIEARFSEIESFADIGEFIDQPVKTYSSGMFVRLAFSVAVNVNPEILIIDEALAVGDEGFQRKCFSRLELFKQQKVTILFVSHATNIVLEICDSACILDKSQILMRAPSKIAVENYRKLILAPRNLRSLVRHEILDFHKSASLSYSDQASKENSLRHSSVYKPNDKVIKPKSSIEYKPNGARIKGVAIRDNENKAVTLLKSKEEYTLEYEILI
ncbi:MAG: ABC transporter ATP-binding protein [Leptolyngbya sp. SIO4C5]|nr:ABC transporter ATP-binding protein [Leptolyngbya sp. SIO4C5]